MDYDKIDESVWDLEICGTNQVDADAFTSLEKSASAAYCSQVLEAFNLAETDEEISDGAESAEETGQMINLPKEIIDRIGSTRKNLFPVFDQFAFSAAKMESLPEKVESKTIKKKWGPVALFPRWLLGIMVARMLLRRLRSTRSARILRFLHASKVIPLLFYILLF
jgi:hypothetical protein